MKVMNFRDLEVWKLGKKIVLESVAQPPSFPRTRCTALTALMRRTSVSIPSDVSEEFNRFRNKEYRPLLFVALGPCAELERQVEICSDLGYLDHKGRGLMDRETRS